MWISGSKLCFTIILVFSCFVTSDCLSLKVNFDSVEFSRLLAEPHKVVTFVADHPTPVSWEFSDGVQHHGMTEVKHIFESTGQHWVSVVSVTGDARKVQVDVQYVRREIRDLDQEDRQRFFAAVNQLKFNGSRRLSTQFTSLEDVIIHHGSAQLNKTCDQAHRAPAFLPWHATLVYEYELALQSIDPSVAAHFWDWTRDAQLKDPKDSIVWTPEFFGSPPTKENNFTVVDGPFAYWPIARYDTPTSTGQTIKTTWENTQTGYLRNPGNTNDSPYLTRYMNMPGVMVGKEELLHKCVRQPSFDEAYNCIFWTNLPGPMEDAIESALHGLVHVWVGGGQQLSAPDSRGNVEGRMGDMMDLTTSPNDPVFLMHHSQVERIHYLWRRAVGDAVSTDEDPCGGYPTETQPAGHNLHDIMMPPFYTWGGEGRRVEKKTGAGGDTVFDACASLRRPELLPYRYETL